MAAYTTFLIKAFSLVLMITIVNVAKGGSVGVNWGRMTSQKLLPSMVVDMCMSNGIKKVKLFSLNTAVLSAFDNSGIEIMVNIPNVELVNINTTEDARAWVHKNVNRYIERKNVDIRYLGLGVEPFSLLETDKGDTTFLNRLVQNVKDVQNGLNRDGIAERVKLVMPHATDVLKRVNKPSEGDFREDLKDTMIKILDQLHANGSPFMVNIYPLLSVVEEGFPVEFGLFDEKHDTIITDGKVNYTNIFDLKYDTLVWALRKNGFGDMKIIVGQVGWPTDGHVYANVTMAKRFFDGLLNKIATRQGTPLQQESDLEIFIHSLVDENQRNIKRGQFERHYGIYKVDGIAKFNIDFTLQGRRDFVPESARGITYLPQRWCILDKKAAEGKEDLVAKNYYNACNISDCTRITDGASCGNLQHYDKVSYAFNIHFQQSNQDIGGITMACDYDGLGQVVEQQPVIDGCEFPVQILSTLFINSLSGSEMQATLGVTPNGAGRLTSASGQMMISTILLIWLLFHLPDEWMDSL